MGPQRIRVLIVDDNSDLTEVFCAAFAGAPDIEWVGALDSADRLLERVVELAPDVVLLDLTMPGCDPVEAMMTASILCPNARTIVLSGHSDPETIERVADRGAWGFAGKDESMDNILQMVRIVAAGGVAFGFDRRRARS
jgi:DNA-binding NarL/FixJ family response regulator